jgi:16S rRNA (cytosine967-C5)-methyltransferase
MRFHKNQIAPISATLIKIFNDNIKAHMAVALMLESNKKWGSNDRKTAAKCVYDIVRYWRRYWFAIDAKPDNNLENYRKIIILWLALEDESINTWEEIEEELIVWKQKFLEVTEPIIKESVSDELNELAIKELGEEIWNRELPILNKETSLILRINTSKARIEKVQDSLRQEGIDTTLIENIPTALLVSKRVNLQKSPTFNQGVFEVQDASSQLIVPFMDIQPDTVVIDACAGAGGKSLHIADALRNSGRVIAMDVEMNKLKELKRRAEKNRFNKIDTHLIQNEKGIQLYTEKADRLLLDVPCTGVGVLRRNADDKYRITKPTFAEVIRKQQEILEQYPCMLKRGGVLVYATCSIFPSENRKQIDKFLMKNPNYTLLEDKTIYPSESGFDGFYMAKLQKN